MEELLRFGIPGFLPLLIPLWLYLHDPCRARQFLGVANLQNGEALLAALFIAAIPVVGYIAHQIHMLIHENKFNSSEKRACISEILSCYDGDDKPTPWQAFLAWDSMSYSLCDREKGLRDHDVRTWQWIHSFQTVRLISFWMMIITIVVGLVFRYYSVFWFILVYLFLFTLFKLKERSTLRHLDAYERVMVHKFWKEIQEWLKETKKVKNLT